MKYHGPAHEDCQKYRFQACHACERPDCCDNTNPTLKLKTVEDIVRNHIKTYGMELGGVVMKEIPMMKCGHAANATDSDGKPSCAICIGIPPGAREINEHPPDLTGRMAECSCHRKVASSTQLPFFEALPDKLCDRFYCGCRGWN